MESSNPNSNHIKLIVTLGGLTLASLLILLDSTIIGTAVPKITDEFHSLKDVGWYGSAFPLGSSALVPLSGGIYHNFPLKWSFLVFFAIFEAGSAICGSATSSAALIAGRVVAGVGASGLINGAFTILSVMVPGEKMPTVLGFLFGIAQLGSVLGPVLGGILTENVSWRWCFYINLPFGGLVAIPLVIVHIPDQITKKSPLLVLRNIHKHIDLVGCALFTGAIVQLLLALQFGGNAFAWSSSQVIGLFIGSAVTFAVWAFWNWEAKNALLPFDIIKRPVVFSSGINYAFLVASIQGSFYFLPIYFQAVKQSGPITSGVYLLAIILPQLPMAVISGKLVSKYGVIPPFALVGAAFNTLGLGLYSLLQPTSPVASWIGFSIISGFGRGIGLNPPLVAAQNAATREEIAATTAFIVWCQYIGPTILLTLLNLVFDNVLRSQLNTLAPDVNAQAVINAGATGFREIISTQDLPNVLQAYANAVDSTFYLAVAAGFISWAAGWGMGWQKLATKEAVPQPQGVVEQKDEKTCNEDEEVVPGT
ncbi:MFS general substrate transporter [Xylariaceae sp. FL0255]|nr:MFS general substrate transporter [Xylariaceae sp. FL0255]